jgi:hypothetical protein
MNAAAPAVVFVTYRAEQRARRTKEPAIEMGGSRLRSERLASTQLRLFP